MSDRVNPLALDLPQAASTNHRQDGGGSLSERVQSLRLPTRPTLNSGSAWLPWSLCLVLAIVAGYFAWKAHTLGIDSSRSDNAQISTAAPRPSSSQPPPPGRVALEAGGYVIPVHRVQVSPKVGGEVVELFIEEGQDVEKGQLLARLDRTKYEFAYRWMKAAADQAEAEYRKLEAGNREEEKLQAAAALREAEHLRDQYKDEYLRLTRARSAHSAEELIRAESKLNQANFKVEQLRQMAKIMEDGARREDRDKAKAAWEHAAAQRDNAKYDLDSCDVVAPISGRILVKRAEVGNTVRPEAFSNGLSASLCEMADLRFLEVDVDVSERDLERVFVGQRCEIRTEAFPDRVYPGAVSRLMPEANRSKACVSVRVSINLPPDDRLVRPEMRARVSFLSPGKDDAQPDAASKEKP